MYIHSFSGAVRGFPIKVYTHFWGYPPEPVFRSEVLDPEWYSGSEVLQLVRAHDARALVVAPHFGA